ncbi:hypothetical protein BCR44DRAFT_1482365 [Catenaria anguillulae PL171]|uniref:Ankyrin repeat-containing domain protein n=1 Tax=Catenaria anguillulae PL171 TaxID=765915 RepID=A0A1Y2I123_9FUNG|nr:hypothetical protein BCR44DRAFT_1482365 [Catenaria anguillulae PL171]
MQLPHMDLDLASQLNNVELLRFMLAWSQKPGGRPVQFSRPIRAAMQSGSIDALNWWLDESQLFFKWYEDDLAAACAGGHVNVLDWWKSRGFPRSEKFSLLKAVWWASNAGHEQVLDWLLAHFAPEQFENVNAERNMMSVAALQRKVGIMNWWYHKAEQGVVKLPSLTDIVEIAFEKKHVSLLEWCARHPVAVEHHYLAGRDRYSSVLACAVKHSLLSWIDRLGIVPFKFEYWPATQAACAAGDFVALKWLHSRQFVFGSRVQVLSCATMAGSIEMLEWIQNHVDVAEPKERLAPPFMFREFDPFLGGFKSERVQVLDWLVDNGYELDSASQFSVESYFEFASKGQNSAVFDWLLARVSSVLEAADLERIAFSTGLEQASYSASVPALDWWLRTLTRTGVVAARVASSAKPAARFFGQLFEKDNVHVLDWWLNRSGQLMDCLDFGSPYVQACGFRQEDTNVIPGLKLWLDSGRGMHFAACINNASLRGNLKVLDWFLHVAKAPVSEFVKAFTCSSFGPGPFSFETHSRSLLWWWANVPHVCNDPSLRINCYQFSNTIHAHILKDMLKYSFVPLQDVCDSSDHGDVAMLMYLKAQSMEQLAFQGPQVEQSLVVASQNDHDNVLDWWRTQSGLQDLKCPQELTSGKLKVGVSTKKWWEEKYGVQLVALRDS